MDTPVAGATVSGTILVSGWAIDNVTGIGTAINPSSMQVKVDGVLVGTATYGVNRLDVCSVYPGGRRLSQRGLQLRPEHAHPDQWPAHHHGLGDGHRCASGHWFRQRQCNCFELRAER